MFPARAGMNRKLGRHGSVLQGVPRTRGDEPLGVSALAPNMSVFPARAGMNRHMLVPLFFPLRVPRTRGDEPVNGRLWGDACMCSPHARG